MEKANRINIGRILKFILIAVGLFIIGAAVFTFFRIRSNGKTALRDAKNIYLALYTTDIKYYAMEKSIYDPAKPDGISDGVKEKVDQLADSDGKYMITSYNSRKRQVTGMQYRNGHYLVTLTIKDGHEIWTVDYSMRLYRLTDK
ncbi:MAG: hypothetical protein K5750_08700 [Eubacterium sp.]|nr:hypothetical protein [Eubacterium sp.]